MKNAHAFAITWLLYLLCACGGEIVTPPSDAPINSGPSAPPSNGMTSDPAPEVRLVIDSLAGAVTQREINAFKAFMLNQQPPPNPWGGPGSHNAMSTGPGGQQVEAMGMMYELSADIDILNRMIFFVDAFVSTRNDLLPASVGGQRVMWTGRIEKIWAGNAPDSPQADYAGGEHADTMAHIVYCAKLILQTPAIWDKTIPDGDPHGYGATYKARALKYISMSDKSNDEYLLKYFVRPESNLIRNPVGWPISFHTMEAINIMAMLDGAFQRLAECHEILGDDPGRVARYDAIVKASMGESLQGMKHAYQVNGQTVYKWYYYPWDVRHVESVGHGAYDMLGIHRAFNRPVYGFLLEDVVPFANTVVHVIAKRNGKFSNFVDGTESRNDLHAQWLLLADWNPAVFDVAKQAIGKPRTFTDAGLVATILWMKNRRASH
jgi:hypothetical protein